jgi:cell wall-associated NlpC family hydrolase
MTGAGSRLVRLTVAAIFTVPLLATALPTTSSAAPTKAQVEAARTRLDQLGHELELAVEQYNTARVRLGLVQQKLQGARIAMQTAQAAADAARTELEQRAVDAYTGAGSQLNVLLGAQSFADFSDRLEFMGTLAQSDVDLANKAQAAGQQAKWAAEQYRIVVAERQSEVDQMAARKTQIEHLVTQQSREYQRISSNYKKYQAYLRQQRAAAAVATDPSSSGTNWSGYVPPPNATAAEVAIGAAKSVIGAPYVWGSADPNVGFDCSGLTSWAWGQAGFSLPHSSEMQYSVLPHVPLDQIVPGDLLFFYTPISHVAMFIGGGLMIHARHPGPGGGVQINAMDSTWMNDFVGAARPG